MAKPSILLIDDNEDVLRGLEAKLREKLDLDVVDILTWVPVEADGKAEEVFHSKVDARTALVITDYDLTTSMKGLFGLSIVAWCQNLSIPVGDFSRGNVAALPKEPNLFELRVPSNDDDGSSFIARTFGGFHAIRTWITQKADLLTNGRSLASVLAQMLERPNLEAQFAPYMARLGAANSALLQKLREFAGPEEPSDDDKIRLMTYVLGHVLCNSILKYPGPLLSTQGLCAYFATPIEEGAALEGEFAAANYAGPFSEGGRYFWRDDVDRIVDGLADGVDTSGAEGFGDFNRAVIEHKFGRALAKHDCDRCGGGKGGFWCPFTQRPVCERADCSVPSSSWIPQGAQLTRVERGFYDEWSPLLGL